MYRKIFLVFLLKKNDEKRTNLLTALLCAVYTEIFFTNKKKRHNFIKKALKQKKNLI